MKDIVKYHNDLNKIQLPSFEAQEMNMLFGIISRIRDQPEGKIITFYPNELLEFSTEHLSNKALGNMLTILKDKFFKAHFTILLENKERNEVGTETTNLFQSFKLWYPEGKNKEYKNLLRVELVVNPRFAYLVNQLTYNFTIYELKELMAISSKYAKRLYCLLKQYRTTGLFQINFDEFMRVLNIPTSYNQCDIDKQVLKPAIKELSERTLFAPNRIAFKNLKYTKIKGKGRGRGGKVIGIEFTFDKEGLTENAIDTQKPTENEALKLTNKELTAKNKRAVEALAEKNKEIEALKAQLAQKSTINDNNRDYEAEWRKLNEQEKKAIIAECQEPSEDEWKATITQEQIEALKAQYAKANSNELARLNNEAQANIGRYVYFNGTMVKIIHAEAFLNDETQQGENKYAIKIILEYESKHRIEIKKDNPFLFRKWLRENYL